MANGSIKVVNKQLYTIDITDEEDKVFHTLKFNLDDVNFPVKVIELYDSAYKEINLLKKQEEELKKEILAEGITEVEDIEDITEENIEKAELSPASRKFFYMQKEGFDKLRNVLDDFLGKGTCQTIFGDINSKTMFEDFLNGLLPEFEKMGVRMKNIQQNAYNKYAPKKKRVL